MGGRRLATGHVANRVLVWDAITGALVHEVGEASKEITPTVNGLAFFPDGKTLAAAGDGFGYTLRLFDTASGRLRRRPLTGHTRWVAAVALAPDGKSLVSGGWDSTLRLWEVATGKQPCPLQRPVRHRRRRRLQFRENLLRPQAGPEGGFRLSGD